MTPERTPPHAMTTRGGWFLQDLGGVRTLIGFAMFLLLSVAAMAGIAIFANLAARQNDSALVYEAADAHLQMVLRGLIETAFSEGGQAPTAVVRSGLDQFRGSRGLSPELTAETAGAWPDIERRIEAMVRERHNHPFNDETLIELGQITASIERIAARIDALADAKRESAATAERRTQMAIIAAGALMILGTLGVFTFVLREVTARKVLGVVRTSEAQLRDITNAVPALIAYVDTERRFRFHNRAYEDAFGLKPEQVQGRTLLEVFGAELYQAMSPKVDEVLAGYPSQFERTQVNVRGELRDYAEHYFPRYSGDARQGKVIGFYSLTTDITEMKRIDRMKSEFISTVSHELRTPLTSIRGSLGLLAGGVAGLLPETAKGLVDIARTNCERLIRLINDILDTEKIEAGEMHLDLKVVDLQLLVARTLADNEGFAGQHQVSLALNAGRGVMRASVDADRLIQVVTNLLSNAVKFSPPQSTVETSLTRAAGRIRVEVRDRGPGIPDEFRGRIFQKFSQADSSDRRQKGGSGLGLNISKAIVEGLGGTIGFRSEPGVGSSFFFELPEWQETAEVVTKAAEHIPNRPSVLVCEHDAQIGQLIVMILDNAGYATDLACTVAQARELAAAKSYAAMTVDLKVPNHHGSAPVQALCEEALMHDLPVVAVSAYAENGRVRINSETLSASEWLATPIDENRMVLAIRNAVDGGGRERLRAPARPSGTSAAQGA
jgi:PAS domain S-box-containing protein